MFVFFIYAVVVWWLAARWRRTWRAYAVAVAGLLGVVLTGWFHLKLNEWTQGRMYVVVLQVLLYPYGALVFGLAMFVSVLPRAARGVPCRQCGYDMTGLEPAQAERLTIVCPECGVADDGWRAAAAVSAVVAPVVVPVITELPASPQTRLQAPAARPVGAWRELAHIARSPESER